jgi:hypothetical protein
MSRQTEDPCAIYTLAIQRREDEIKGAALEIAFSAIGCLELSSDDNVKHSSQIPPPANPPNIIPPNTSNPVRIRFL